MVNPFFWRLRLNTLLSSLTSLLHTSHSFCHEILLEWPGCHNLITSHYHCCWHTGMGWQLLYSETMHWSSNWAPCFFLAFYCIFFSYQPEWLFKHLGQGVSLFCTKDSNGIPSHWEKNLKSLQSALEAIHIQTVVASLSDSGHSYHTRLLPGLPTYEGHSCLSYFKLDILSTKDLDGLFFTLSLLFNYQGGV